MPHRCALFFDGNIVTEAAPRAFFSGNSFYTTSANRIARDAAAGSSHAGGCDRGLRRSGRAGTGAAGVSAYSACTGEGSAGSEKAPGLAQGACRRIRYRVAGADDPGHRRDRSDRKLVDAGGLTGLAGSQMRLYGILLRSLLVFALSIGRKADRPDYLIQTPVEKRKLSEPHDFCDGFDPPAHSADTVHRCVLLRRETVLFHSAAHSARMYAAVLPHFRGAKAAGTGAGADCRARCTECGRPRRVLHAAGIQAGRGNDDPGGRGLWWRNGILSRRDDHAGFEYAVFARPVDTVADVRYGVNRLAGGSFVPQGRPAAVEAQSVHLRRDRLYRDLRRYYESRVGAHVVRIGQLEDHHELLHHRHSGRSGTCSRYVRLSSGSARSRCWKSWTGSKQNTAWRSKLRRAVRSVKELLFSYFAQAFQGQCRGGRGFYSCPAALGMS